MHPLLSITVPDPPADVDDIPVRVKTLGGAVRKERGTFGVERRNLFS